MAFLSSFRLLLTKVDAYRQDWNLSVCILIITRFNLPHDDDYKCRQFPEQKSGIYHVMAPTLDYNTHPWTWSHCSTAMLTEFLEQVSLVFKQFDIFRKEPVSSVLLEILVTVRLKTDRFVSLTPCKCPLFFFC